MRLRIICVILAVMIGSELGAVEKKDSLLLKLFLPANSTLYNDFNHNNLLEEGIKLAMKDSVEAGLAKMVEGLKVFDRGTNFSRMLDYQTYEFFKLLNLGVNEYADSVQKEMIIEFFRNTFKRDIKAIDKVLNQKWEKTSHPETALRLALLVATIRQDEKKIDKTLKELLDNFPELFAPNLLKADQLFLKEEWLKSKFYFERAININSTSSYAYLKKGNCNVELDLIDDAKEDLRKATMLSPTYSNAWYDLGRLYYKQGQYEKAIDAYKKVNTINPFFAWTYQYIGDSYSNLNQLDSAVHYYNIAIGMQPNNADFLNGKGDVYYDNKNFEEAAYNYSSAINLNSNKDYFYEDRGLAYYELESWDEAIADFTKAFEMDPNSDFAVKKIGDCYASKQQYKTAIQFYTQAISIDSEYDNAISSRAYCNIMLKDYEAALKDCNRVVELRPNRRYSWKARADCLIKMKNYEGARKDLLKAIEIDPTDGNAYGNLGWVCYCLDDFQKTIEYSEKACSLDNEAYFAKFNKALATLRLQKIDMANQLYREYYREAVDNAIDYKGAVQDLKDLIHKGILVEESTYIIEKILYQSL